MADIYFVQAASGGPIKIGVTTGLKQRLGGLQTGSPLPLVLLGSVRCDPYTERVFHAYLWRHRMHGEWFYPAPTVLEVVAMVKAGASADDVCDRLKQWSRDAMDAYHAARDARRERRDGRMAEREVLRRACRLAVFESMGVFE